MKTSEMVELILVVGNPMDGYVFIGPFVTYEDANKYIETDFELSKGGVFIAQLFSPCLDTD